MNGIRMSMATTAVTRHDHMVSFGEQQAGVPVFRQKTEETQKYQKRCKKDGKCG